MYRARPLLGPPSVPRPLLLIPSPSTPALEFTTSPLNPLLRSYSKASAVLALPRCHLNSLLHWLWGGPLSTATIRSAPSPAPSPGRPPTPPTLSLQPPDLGSQPPLLSPAQSSAQISVLSPQSSPSLSSWPQSQPIPHPRPHQPTALSPSPPALNRSECLCVLCRCLGRTLRLDLQWGRNRTFVLP